MQFSISSIYKIILSSLLIFWWLVVFSYSPTLRERQTLQTVVNKIDELATTDRPKIDTVYSKIQQISETQNNLLEWQIYLLNEIEAYIFINYIAIKVDEADANIDLVSDTSLYKYVSDEISYSNPYFIPADLVMLYENENLSLGYGTWLSYMMISERVHPWLQELAIAYTERFGIPLKVNSAWRSFEFQRDEFSQKCRDDGFCAKPGHSEHQSGMAVDLNGMYGDYYIWMTNNAHEFWFHQSYQKWQDVDGYHEEKWHRRYLWTELATELQKRWITYSEMYQEIWE